LVKKAEKTPKSQAHQIKLSQRTTCSRTRDGLSIYRGEESFDGQPEAKGPLRRSTRRWEYNIEMNLKEIE
jgi:hypothetical protein